MGVCVTLWCLCERLNCLLSPELCREPISAESHFPLPPPLLSRSPLFSEALGKMKDVYEKNPQMGDPASLASQISQTSQNIERLRGELNKYEVIPTSVVYSYYEVIVYPSEVIQAFSC